ncbi:MAG: ATP-dependent DNA ligase [Polyangiaceae bacterium]
MSGSSDEQVSWQRFAELCEALAAVSGKIAKRSQIASYLREISVADKTTASLAALYLSGAPFAEDDTRGLNVGGRLLSSAVAEIAQADDERMSTTYRKYGDMGAAAADLIVGESTEAPLDILEIEKAFSTLATTRVQAAKQTAVKSLLLRTRNGETPNLQVKALVKLILGDMRIGVKQSLVEEAIAEAAGAPIEDIRHAVALTGSLFDVAMMAWNEALSTAKMKLFHPLGFMLASPAENVDDATNRFVEAEGAVKAQVEDKYDGIRAQAHFGDGHSRGKVAIFSRTRGDITKSFPEIAEVLAHADTPAILDGEILAWDFKNDRALPFSSLQTRLGRKKVTDQLRKETPVVFMAFDVLFAEGALQIEKPLRERRRLLESIVEKEKAAARSGLRRMAPRGQMSLFGGSEKELNANPERLRISPAFAVNSAADLDKAYAESRERGNEGVMLKALDSQYQPGRRGLAWIKLKRELATLDVVVTAAEYGHGNRAKVLSDYTFAVRDGDELKNVGKAYSGLTDAEIKDLTKWFTEHTLEDRGWIRTVEPTLVLEVAFNNIMESGRHESGFALRFPRIVRIRTDKPASEIDTVDRVREIFSTQPDRVRE